MDMERIRDLVYLVKESGIGELVIEEPGCRVSIRMPGFLSSAGEGSLQRIAASEEPMVAGSVTGGVASDEAAASGEPVTCHGAEVSDDIVAPDAAVPADAVAGGDVESDEPAALDDSASDKSAVLDDAAADGSAGDEAVASDDSASDAVDSGDAAMRGETASAVSASAANRPASWIPVTSPVVGTFYASPAPGDESFVSVGKAVGAGKPLGIVKAMNIGNRIKAQEPGVVREVCVKDGDPVQYGTVLMYMEPADDVLLATLESK